MKTGLALLILCFFSHLILAQDVKPDDGKPFVLGKTYQIYSDKLAEDRTLNVYLPEGYNPKDTTRYPVIYLLDGGADEDFIHVVGLVQFNSFEWVNRVPKSIVVGIANTDRKRDMTYPTTIQSDLKRFPTTGHSAQFITFLQSELQPYIERKFKTNTSKTLIGESLGGLLATEVLLTHPTLFNKYIIISPSLWWDNGSLLKVTSTMLNADVKAPTQVYLAVGKEGLTPTEIPRVMEVDVNLLAEKLKATKSKAVSVYFDYLPLEDHATVSHQALLNGFRALSGK